jgi:hypothetical protein
MYEECVDGHDLLAAPVFPDVYPVGAMCECEMDRIDEKLSA